MNLVCLKKASFPGVEIAMGKTVGVKVGKSGRARSYIILNSMVQNLF